MCSEDMNVNCMQMNSQIHSPAVLSSEKVLPVISEYESGRADDSDKVTKAEIFILVLTRN